MIKVVIFTNDRQKSVQFPDVEEVDFQHIEFYSSKLDDLTLIAKFRVLKYPTSLVLNGNNKVLFRMQGIIDKSTLNELVNA